MLSGSPASIWFPTSETSMYSGTTLTFQISRAWTSIHMRSRDTPSSRGTFSCAKAEKSAVVRSGEEKSTVASRRRFTAYDRGMCDVIARVSSTMCCRLLSREALLQMGTRVQSRISPGRSCGAHRFAFPPSDEQRIIQALLDKTEKRIRNVVAGQTRTIGLLREYRTRLIADVVTGKLDVREAAATLPDLVPYTAAGTLKDSAEPIAKPEPAIQHSHP